MASSSAQTEPPLNGFPIDRNVDDDEDSQLDLMLQQAARLAAQMRSTVGDSKQGQSPTKSQAQSEDKQADDEGKKLPPLESPSTAVGKTGGLPSAINISDQGDHSDVISAVTYPAELEKSKKKCANNSQNTKMRAKHAPTPATDQQEEVEAAVRASEEMARALQVLNAGSFRVEDQASPPVVTHTHQSSKDDADAKIVMSEPTRKVEGITVPSTGDADFVPIMDYVAKAISEQEGGQEMQDTEHVNSTLLAPTFTSTSDPIQTTPSWKLYSEGADTFMADSNDNVPIKDYTTTTTNPATARSETSVRVPPVKEAAGETQGEEEKAATTTILPHLSPEGEYSGSPWRFYSAAGNSRKESDPISEKHNAQNPPPYITKSDEPDGVAPVRTPARQDPPGEKVSSESSPPNWLQLSTLQSPTQDNAPQSDKPSLLRLAESKRENGAGASGAKPNWLQMATLTEPLVNFPPMEKPSGASISPQVSKPAMDQSLQQKQDEVKVVAKAAGTSGVASVAASTTWQKVEAATENDDDFVKLRDYSAAPLVPNESKLHAGMKWTKLDEVRAGDIDFVPIRGLATAGTPISKKEQKILQNVSSSKAKEVTDGFCMMGAERLRTPANVKWERVDYAEENDDDYVPLRDYSNTKSKSSKESVSESRKAMPPPSSSSSIEHTIQAAYKARDYNLDAYYKIEQEEDTHANRITFAVTALILLILGLAFYTSDRLFLRAAVNQPQGLYHRSRKHSTAQRPPTREASTIPDKSKEAEELVRSRQQKKLDGRKQQQQQQQQKKEPQLPETEDRSLELKGEGDTPEGQHVSQEDKPSVIEPSQLVGSAIEPKRIDPEGVFCSSPIGFISKRCGKQPPKFEWVAWKEAKKDPNQILDILDIMYQ
mmetsp:Transcript_17045/g.46740  ORF Transcript_17045/g.46740 Transcript_17045/m.46740 type:complete len:884 (+) Transcript_17045:192-2843(+)|eukprot:CAMPEP_0168721978 /NCGR_PEP_ID=MMETSP0724-20121128/2363_1 /TAXON_ID=265536 /ORGANISM="Amphiprora sp., Strain CCMP467" /LENGTH=883 /DNA_ID=CAMNT_0008768641 /DNA_START=109 /DNA_END=2760 /DNA_ORIENTATION=+